MKRVDTPLKRTLAEAAEAAEPVAALRVVAGDALANGTSREALLETLEALRSEVQPTGEDAVLDVMDMLAGWSAPHTRL